VLCPLEHLSTLNVDRCALGVLTQATCASGARIKREKGTYRLLWYGNSGHDGPGRLVRYVCRGVPWRAVSCRVVSCRDNEPFTPDGEVA